MNIHRQKDRHMRTDKHTHMYMDTDRHTHIHVLRNRHTTTYGGLRRASLPPRTQ